MKIVIVGGGFAGVEAALNLSKDSRFSITLISDRTYFEYHAALYRTVAGRPPLEVAVSLADIFDRHPNVQVVKDRIAEIDADSSLVVGESESRYNYDRLILATGNVTQYFGIAGLEEFSYGVKSVQESLELKRHLHDELTSGMKPDLHYVVVGGGATGVEVAAEISSYLKQLRLSHGKPQKKYQVILVEAAPRILPNMPETYAARIARRLKKIGVKIYVSTAVKAETADKLQLPEGDISTRTVIWTAGVANNSLLLAQDGLFRFAKNGRVEVDGKMQGAPNIYVIGDGAATVYSGMAQTALYDADFVTDNLIRELGDQPLRTYSPPQPISAIPVGGKWSAVLWNNRQIFGYAGWVLRRLADLKIFLKIFPLKVAIQCWRYGGKRQESCEICR